MKVSVVIPVYNEEKYIKNCLDSLMKQVEKPDEIIVIDNNCKDNTIRIVKAYKYIKVIKETKQGMIPARNTGFNATKYEIIAKCDADTVVPPDWIKKIKKNFLNTSSIVAISMPIRLSDILITHNLTFLYYLYMFIPKLIIGFYPMLGPGYALRKSVWNKVKNDVCLDDRLVHEDIDLTFHIKKYGEIFHDKNTVISSSARRILNNPLSFFGEYKYRFFKMFFTHRNFFKTVFVKRVLLILLR